MTIRSLGGAITDAELQVMTDEVDQTSTSQPELIMQSHTCTTYMCDIHKGNCFRFSVVCKHERQNGKSVRENDYFLFFKYVCIPFAQGMIVD